MKASPEYRDLAEIRELLETFWEKLNEINLYYARTDFRSDSQYVEADPFIIIELLEITDKLILIHKDINQTDIIRLLIKRIIEKSSSDELFNICHKLYNRGIILSEQELISQTRNMSLAPDTLHVLIYLLIQPN